MKNYAFGVDIGGTTCKIGLFEASGKLLEKWEIDTVTDDKGSHILDNIKDAVWEKMTEKSISQEDILGIGLGVPSPVTVEGIAKGAVNLGWFDYDVYSEMSQKTGMKIRVGNDVNVASLGELWMGSAAGSSNAIMVALGTGVGGGIIVNSHVIYGAAGSAGEIGHIIVNPAETECCGCGRKGCLEQYASATGIVRMAKNRLVATTADSALRRCDPLTAKDVFDCAKVGDVISVQLVELFGQILGYTLADMACILNPEMIVIGGGVSKAGQIIIDTVQKYFRERALFTCTDTKFTLASLGNDAGIYGAVRMLFD